MRKLKKVKSKRIKHDGAQVVMAGFNARPKRKGELYTRVLKKSKGKNLLLAWQIQKAEANS